MRDLIHETGRRQRQCDMGVHMAEVPVHQRSKPRTSPCWTASSGAVPSSWEQLVGAGHGKASTSLGAEGCELLQIAAVFCISACNSARLTGLMQVTSFDLA